MSFNPATSGVSGAADVAISTKQDNQVLTYDSAIDKWRNQEIAIAGVSGLIAALSAKYSKPDTGIPISDLSNDAQMRLNSTVSATVADGSITTAKIAENAVTPVKLAISVQSSLAKADTSLQTVQRSAANGVAALDSNGKVPNAQLTTPIVTMTQSAYDGLGTKDPATLYVIVG